MIWTGMGPRNTTESNPPESPVARSMKYIPFRLVPKRMSQGEEVGLAAGPSVQPDLKVDPLRELWTWAAAQFCFNIQILEPMTPHTPYHPRAQGFLRLGVVFVWFGGAS